MSRIHHIRVPGPPPIEWVNTYFVDDSSPALIDAGPATDEALEALEHALGEIGRKIQDIDRLLITHGHADHTGLAGTLAEMSGAPVYLHPADGIREFKAGPDERRHARQAFVDFMIEGGVPREHAEITAAAMLQRFDELCAPIPYLVDLVGEEEFVFDDFVLSAVPTPGHSPGCVSFLEKQSGDFFSGDALIEEIISNPVSEVRDASGRSTYRVLEVFLAMLDAVEKLPLKTVRPGHGGPTTDVIGRLNRLRKHHERRRAAVLDIVQSADNGDPEGMTHYDVARRLFPSMAGREVFFRTGAARGHLERLCTEGLVTEIRSNGIFTYRSAS